MTKILSPKCVVMGSFRFKPEIDLAIKELKDNRISVLGPDEGGLFKSDIKDFWPLASERRMTRGLVEQLFIKKIFQSDFVYIVNPDGYIGDAVSLEVGVCVARDIHVYSSKEIDKKLDPDPHFAEAIDRYIRVESIDNIIKLEIERKNLEEGAILKPNLIEILHFNNYHERK